MKRIIVLRCLSALTLLFWYSVSLSAQTNALTARPSDPEATRKAEDLFNILHTTQGKCILFGHQDDLAYGIGWRKQPGGSDVKAVCGAYPAVFGWELGRQMGDTMRYNIDSVAFADMRHWAKQAYKMGGINTFSWHWDNPKTGDNSWDPTPAVADILPGAPLHYKLIDQLDRLAVFFNSLQAGPWWNRHRIPIIFRPWHEHTGSWFWWGANNCTPEEYKQLFRFTVDYLRKTKGLHQVLFAYSPDAFRDTAEYLRNYPGDAYVDVMGLDYYYREPRLPFISADIPEKLRMVAQLAAEHGKIAAFTETGLESIPLENWWTQMLLSHLASAQNPERGSGIAYVLVWRNARTNHHFAPYPGQRSAGDFVNFSRDTRVILAGPALKDLYRKEKRKK